jgi:hypothetical protein
MLEYLVERVGEVARVMGEQGVRGREEGAEEEEERHGHGRTAERDPEGKPGQRERLASSRRPENERRSQKRARRGCACGHRERRDAGAGGTF